MSNAPRTTASSSGFRAAGLKVPEKVGGGEGRAVDIRDSAVNKVGIAQLGNHENGIATKSPRRGRGGCVRRDSLPSRNIDPIPTPQSVRISDLLHAASRAWGSRFGDKSSYAAVYKDVMLISYAIPIAPMQHNQNLERSRCW